MDFCRALDEHTRILQDMDARLGDVESILRRLGITNTGDRIRVVGSRFEVSDEQLAVWDANATLPLDWTQGNWARLRAGKVEALGSAFDFRSAASGARILFDDTGLSLYDAANVRTVWLDAATGNAEFTGKITASEGEIAGWTISTTQLSKNNAILSSDGYLQLGDATLNEIVRLDAVDATWRIWVGDTTPGNAPFRVDKAGNCYATAFYGVGEFEVDVADQQRYRLIVPGTVPAEYWSWWVKSGVPAACYIGRQNYVGAATFEFTQFTLGQARLWITPELDKAATLYLGDGVNGYLYINYDGAQNAQCWVNQWWQIVAENGLDIAGTNRNLRFDANDYWTYDTANNVLKWLVGAADALAISPADFTLWLNALLEKTGTATDLTQYPSYTLRWRGSGWDTTNLTAVDLDIYAKVTAGSGVAGAIPYALRFYNNGDTEIFAIDKDGNVTLGGTVDGVDLAAFKAAYDAHAHAAGDPTQVSHTDLLNIGPSDHHSRYTDAEAVAAAEAASFNSLEADYFWNQGDIYISADNAAADTVIYLRNNDVTYKADVAAERNIYPLADYGGDLGLTTARWNNVRVRYIQCYWAIYFQQGGNCYIWQDGAATNDPMKFQDPEVGYDVRLIQLRGPQYAWVSCGGYTPDGQYLGHGPAFPDDSGTWGEQGFTCRWNSGYNDGSVFRWIRCSVKVPADWKQGTDIEIHARFSCDGGTTVSQRILFNNYFAWRGSGDTWGWDVSAYAAPDVTLTGDTFTDILLYTAPGASIAPSDWIQIAIALSGYDGVNRVALSQNVFLGDVYIRYQRDV